MAHSHWHGCAGFRRVSALAAKQKWKHCSPSWQTPQKVTDITIAFLSLTVIPSLFFWRFRDQVCSCSCHLWHMYKAWEYTECVFVCLKYFFCVRVCAGCPTDKITFHCFLYSTNFILFLFFFTSTQLVRHNEWKSQRGCFGVECQSSSNTLETT